MWLLNSCRSKAGEDGAPARARPAVPRGGGGRLCRHAVSALLLLVGLGPAGAEPFRIVVTEQTTPLLPNSVIELADRLGYFKREGVNVELVHVEQTPLAIAAMMSGGGDMADVSVEAVVKLAAHGHEDLKAVMSANTRFPYVVAARDSVRSVEELARMSFGIGRIGSLDHTLTMHVLRARGLDPSALELVSIGRPDLRLLALATGRIAATTVSIGTWIAFPSRTRLHILVSEHDFASAAPVVAKVMVVPVKVLEARRAAVISVVAALIKAARDFAAHPSTWTAAMAKARPDVGAADLRRLAAVLKGRWSTNGGLNRNDLAFTMDWLYQNPDFAGLPPVPMRAWTDFSVADAVLAELGIDRAADPPLR